MFKKSIAAIVSAAVLVAGPGHLTLTAAAQTIGRGPGKVSVTPAIGTGLNTPAPGASSFFDMPTLPQGPLSSPAPSAAPHTAAPTPVVSVAAAAKAMPATAKGSPLAVIQSQDPAVGVPEKAAALKNLFENSPVTGYEALEVLGQSAAAAKTGLSRSEQASKPVGAINPRQTAAWRQNLLKLLHSIELAVDDVKFYADVPPGLNSGPNVVSIAMSRDSGDVAKAYTLLESARPFDFFPWWLQNKTLEFVVGNDTFRTSIPFPGLEIQKVADARQVMRALGNQEIATYIPAMGVPPFPSALQYERAKAKDFVGRDGLIGWKLYRRGQDQQGKARDAKNYYLRWAGAVAQAMPSAPSVSAANTQAAVDQAREDKGTVAGAIPRHVWGGSVVSLAISLLSPAAALAIGIMLGAVTMSVASSAQENIDASSQLFSFSIGTGIAALITLAVSGFGLPLFLLGGTSILTGILGKVHRAIFLKKISADNDDKGAVGGKSKAALARFWEQTKNYFNLNAGSTVKRSHLVVALPLLAGGVLTYGALGGALGFGLGLALILGATATIISGVQLPTDPKKQTPPAGNDDKGAVGGKLSGRTVGTLMAAGIAINVLFGVYAGLHTGWIAGLLGAASATAVNPLGSIGGIVGAVFAEKIMKTSGAKTTGIALLGAALGFGFGVVVLGVAGYIGFTVASPAAAIGLGVAALVSSLLNVGFKTIFKTDKNPTPPADDDKGAAGSPLSVISSQDPMVGDAEKGIEVHGLPNIRTPAELLGYLEEVSISIRQFLQSISRPIAQGLEQAVIKIALYYEKEGVNRELLSNKELQDLTSQLNYVSGLPDSRIPAELLGYLEGVSISISKFLEERKAPGDNAVKAARAAAERLHAKVVAIPNPAASGAADTAVSVSKEVERLKKFSDENRDSILNVEGVNSVGVLDVKAALVVYLDGSLPLTTVKLALLRKIPALKDYPVQYEVIGSAAFGGDQGSAGGNAVDQPSSSETKMTPNLKRELDSLQPGQRAEAALAMIFRDGGDLFTSTLAGLVIGATAPVWMLGAIVSSSTRWLSSDGKDAMGGKISAVFFLFLTLVALSFMLSLLLLPLA